MTKQSFIAQLVPQSIGGRTIAVVLIGVVLIHAISIIAYRLGLDSEVDLANQARLAERLYTTKRALAKVRPEEREDFSHSLSGGPIEIHWSSLPLAIEGSRSDADSARLKHHLLELAPELDAEGVVIGTPKSEDGQKPEPHLLLVSLQLSDASWVTFSIARLTGAHDTVATVVLATSVTALGVLALSVMMLRSVTRPLKACAAAAQRLYVVAEPEMITVEGPKEVKELAQAFNGLQQRVKRVIDDRTLTLAAISHDLKTPLTRARLRGECVGEAELRAELNDDFVEMSVMIDSVLDFLAGDRHDEHMHALDLNAILSSIVDEMTDLGHDVSFNPGFDVVVLGRHLALKRAFTNLIGNAVKYGVRARIAVEQHQSDVLVSIDDDGSGIPEELREAVFAPFYRIEGSRGRDTGGTGLGLTIARSVMRGHGGDITLHNSESGGLRVLVRLPHKSVSVRPQKQFELQGQSS